MSGTVPLNGTSVGNATNATGGTLGGNIVVQGADGSQYWLTVEQGPVWLAQMLYTPPDWLVPALYALLLAVLAGAAYKVVRKGIDPKALREAANRAVLVTSVATVGFVLNRSGLFPYAIDVVGTVVLGVVIARYIRSHPTWDETLDELVPLEEGPADG